MTRISGALLLSCLLAILPPAHSQSLSGSTGSDGALVLTHPGTTIFDPHGFSPPLNPSGDNVYHFTSIHIASGVTLKLSATLLNGPVFWLVQGPVQIDGTINLDGSNGERGPSLAGAGGYSGGAAQHSGYSPGGSFKPNIFLVPLVGGPGGSGGAQAGGAGGGALLIASSTSITVNGAITANGGSSPDGTGGDGGAIRLVAPVITGATGLLSGKGGQPGGTDGLVRFEAFQNEFSGNMNNTPFALGKPLGLFLPPNPAASVRVVSIGGVSVAAQDFTTNQVSAVAVVIEARFIPPGTVVELELFPDSGPSQTIVTTPLQGTFQVSRAIASVTFPSGSFRSQVKATWKQPQQGDHQP